MLLHINLPRERVLDSLLPPSSLVATCCTFGLIFIRSFRVPKDLKTSVVIPGHDAEENSKVSGVVS